MPLLPFSTMPVLRTKKICLLTTLSLVGGLIASCSTNPPTTQPNLPQTNSPLPPNVITQPTPTRPPMVTPTSQPKLYPSFSAWKSDFVERAASQGYNRADLQQLVNNAQYNEQVISQDKNQAEFAKMPWEYVDGAVSGNRVQGGQRNYANQQAVLMRAENQYGVPASIVTAIWGMESSYGAGMGNSSLISSLATLAYEGRRRSFAEEQLLALLQLVERGDLDWSQLKGSWAGGMGHTQFIPKTWLIEGVDGNGDGKKSPFTSADALSSTASYLSRAGWQRGVAPFYEVNLPTNFDYHNLNTKKTVAQWQRIGVQLLNSAPSDAVTELWLPAGKAGPALLLTKSFDAIKVYNNSANYALGVSLLARAIVGQGGLQHDFPRYEKPLYTYQITQLQQRLTNLGFDTRGTDGILGTNTKLAFARWQSANGQTPDGFISQRTAAALMQ